LEPSLENLSNFLGRRLALPSIVALPLASHNFHSATTMSPPGCSDIHPAPPTPHPALAPLAPIVPEPSFRSPLPSSGNPRQPLSILIRLTKSDRHAFAALPDQLKPDSPEHNVVYLCVVGVDTCFAAIPSPESH